MHSKATESREIPLWKRLAAGFFLVAFLAIHAVSVSEKLHHAVHHDAAETNHKCVFVQVSNGQCLCVADNPPSLSLPLIREATVIFAFSFAILPSQQYLLLPSRAPPVLPS